MFTMFLLILSDNFCLQGVKVIQRTRELEEQQAQRYIIVLCFVKKNG